MSTLVPALQAMTNTVRSFASNVRCTIWMSTHLDFQDDEGHLYSVSIFSLEFLQDGSRIGGRFRRNPFARTTSTNEFDDCPFSQSVMKDTTATASERNSTMPLSK